MAKPLDTIRYTQFFRYDHLPEPLKKISEPFSDLAAKLMNELPATPDTEKALDHLLQAKDWAVRARLK